MTDPAGTKTEAASHVYYRRADGNGTQTWKEHLSSTEARAEVRWCFGAVKDATMVWIVQEGSNVAPEIFLREPA